jgi:hypothetical protein
MLDGLPIVDATKPLLVTINATDIRHSVRKDGDYCAAAMALCRDDKIEDAFVHLGRTYVRYWNRWVRYLTSAALRRNLISFDQKGVFTPGTYRLGAPPPSAQLGSGYHTEYSRLRGKTRKPRLVHRVKGVREQAPHIVGEHFTLPA